MKGDLLKEITFICVQIGSKMFTFVFASLSLSLRGQFRSCVDNYVTFV